MRRRHAALFTEEALNLRSLFGREDSPEEEGDGPVVIRVEVNGRTFTRRYPDRETAQLRFPQYLSDLAALQCNVVE